MKENADKARALDTAELDKQLRDSAEQMFRLRFQTRMGQMEGLKKLRMLRKERARMLTVLRERELNPEATVTKPAASGKKSKSAAKAKPAAKAPAAKVKPAAKPKVAKSKTDAKPKAAAKPKTAAGKAA